MLSKQINEFTFLAAFPAEENRSLSRRSPLVVAADGWVVRGASQLGTDADESGGSVPCPMNRGWRGTGDRVALNQMFHPSGSAEVLISKGAV